MGMIILGIFLTVGLSISLVFVKTGEERKLTNEGLMVKRSKWHAREVIQVNEHIRTYQDKVRKNLKEWESTLSYVSSFSTVTKESLMIQTTPIFISGNDEFAEQARKNGWPGKGTAESPYIIENFSIISGDSVDPVIFIQNTDVSFIIRNCTISARQIAIYLNNVENAIIANNTIFHRRTGILVLNSNHNMFLNNRIQFVVTDTGYMLFKGDISLENSRNNYLGNNTAESFFLDSSNENVLVNNVSINATMSGFMLLRSRSNDLLNNLVISSFREGFLIDTGDNFLLENKVFHSRVGFSFSYGDSGIVVKNQALNCSNAGFEIEKSDNVVFVDNVASGNGANGFLFYFDSDGQVLVNNTAVRNAGFGFSLKGSTHAVIVNNSAIENGINGFELVDVNRIKVINNTALLNQMNGMLIDGSSSHNLFLENWFINNTSYGMFIRGSLGDIYSSDNVVKYNAFIFNNLNGDKEAASNVRDGIFDYNYWSTHHAPDVDHDGILDQPYSLGGIANLKDDHPLASPSLIWSVKDSRGILGLNLLVDREFFVMIFVVMAMVLFNYKYDLILRTLIRSRKYKDE